MDSKSIIRPAAVKLLLGDLSSGSYIEEDEQSLNYFLTADQRRAYRLNVLGIIIDKQKQGNITNFLLDDNTGKMVMRTFEENKNINGLNVGEVILMVGKVRKYNQELYLSPDIIKLTNPLWLKARSMELGHKSFFTEKCPEQPREKIMSRIPEIKPLHLTSSTEEEIIIEEEVVEESTEEIQAVRKNDLPSQKIIVLIKEMDKGNGVLIEELMEKSLLNDTEKVLQKMLEKGDIFQNLPGRVKVL